MADASGRLYRLTSDHSSFRITSWDGKTVESKTEDAPPGAHEVVESPQLRNSDAFAPWGIVSASPQTPEGPGTTLTLNKAAGDLVLSWTGTGTAYAGARATDAPFANAATLFAGFGGTSYAYVGAVANSRRLEFFDVTDETENNRGGNWNGGDLPPPPPVVDTGNPSTNIGSLFVGSTGTIAGSGFSSVPGNNTVCFNGGVCTQATTATTAQIQFVTPPGALTGGISVTVGNQTSESKTGAAFPQFELTL